MSFGAYPINQITNFAIIAPKLRSVQDSKFSKKIFKDFSPVSSKFYVLKKIHINMFKFFFDKMF